MLLKVPGASHPAALVHCDGSFGHPSLFLIDSTEQFEILSETQISNL